MRALCLHKPSGVINFTESRPSHNICWPEIVEFLTFSQAVGTKEGTLHAETIGSNKFYSVQTFAQNLYASDDGSLAIVHRAGGTH